MFLTTTFDLPNSHLVAAFCGAFETGACSEWLGTVDAHGYQDDATYDANFQFRVQYVGEDDEEGSPDSSMVIDNERVAEGLKVMAEKHPKDFFALLTGNDDAFTHDVLLQCIVFNELVYG